MAGRLIVAIDTAGPVLGVAVHDSERIERITRGGETRIVPWVVELCGDLDRIAAIGVCVGPGAFTGLRVGLSTAQGLAQALEVPLYGFGALHSRGVRVEADLALLDARKGRVYSGRKTTDYAPRDIAPEVAVQGLPRGFLATGEGAGVYREIVEAAGGHVHEDFAHPSVDSLVRLTRQAFESRLAGRAADVLPVYVRAPDAVPPRRGI